MSMQIDENRGTVAGSNELPATVNVWDPLVRIFHWSMVSLYVLLWISGDNLAKTHIVAGYALVIAMIIRLVWGGIGTKHARFTDFVCGPKTVLKYLADMSRFRAKRYLGHNPAGGAMVIALIITLSIVSATGYMATMDAFWGLDWVEELHEATANLSLLLIGLHIAGVLYSSFEHGENLIKAMITGRKNKE